MNEDNSLDLLDLDDAETMDSLPEAPVLTAPRPKKPWLLLTVGLFVIVLASYVIIRAIGTESSSSMEIDLDAPVVMVDERGNPVDMNVMPPVKPGAPLPSPTAPVKPVVAPAPVAVAPAPVVQTAPVRVIEERKEVKFEPAKAAERPKAAPVAKKTVAPVQPKPLVKKQAVATVSNWYVQFGSYSTRALAEAAQRKLTAAHASLFSGKQFVVLAAQLKNGTTTYRLRVGFNTSGDANGFCRNAKADGLDCYVTK